jgi:stage II sporulation protein AA (anti-sigma F factor antagonist)
VIGSLTIALVELRDSLLPSQHAVWRLTLTRHDIENVVVIDLAGRLSAASAPELTRLLASAGNDDRRSMLIDLTELDYISSAGLRGLQRAAERLQAAGSALAVTGLCEPVRLAFTLAGPIPNLTIFESRDAALRAITNGG